MACSAPRIAATMRETSRLDSFFVRGWRMKDWEIRRLHNGHVAEHELLPQDLGLRRDDQGLDPCGHPSDRQPALDFNCRSGRLPHDLRRVPTVVLRRPFFGESRPLRCLVSMANTP